LQRNAALARHHVRCTAGNDAKVNIGFCERAGNVANRTITTKDVNAIDATVYSAENTGGGLSWDRLNDIDGGVSPEHF